MNETGALAPAGSGFTYMTALAEESVPEAQPYPTILAMDASRHPANPDPAGDAQLLRRGQTGDEAAFAELVERHRRYLFGIARSLTQSPMDAEDIFQETLLAGLTGHFRGEAAVRTWLVQILVRQAAMLRRKQSRWRLRLAPASRDPQTPGPLDKAATPSGEAAADFRMDLEQVLGSLSPEFRQVLVLRELEGLSYDEMSEMLGVPRGTVESRLFRARQALKQSADWMEK